MLAADNAHNAELAGSVLMGLVPDVDSFELAVRRALATTVTPSVVNDAAEYFDRRLEPA